MTDVNSRKTLLPALYQPACPCACFCFSFISPEHWPQVARKSDNALTLKSGEDLAHSLTRCNLVALLAPVFQAEKCTLHKIKKTFLTHNPLWLVGRKLVCE